ncbi:MAG TPA: hypothetical protein VGB54_08300 [Allosphingosinicella sp.]|jgi:hypothetical protein
MDGRGIGAAALADAGLRRLASEMAGPRPAGTNPAGRPDMQQRTRRPDGTASSSPTRP